MCFEQIQQQYTCCLSGLFFENDLLFSQILTSIHVVAHLPSYTRSWQLVRIHLVQLMWFVQMLVLPKVIKELPLS